MGGAIDAYRGRNRSSRSACAFAGSQWLRHGRQVRRGAVDVEGVVPNQGFEGDAGSTDEQGQVNTFLPPWRRGLSLCLYEPAL